MSHAYSQPCNTCESGHSPATAVSRVRSVLTHLQDASFRNTDPAALPRPLCFNDPLGGSELKILE